LFLLVKSKTNADENINFSHDNIRMEAELLLYGLVAFPDIIGLNFYSSKTDFKKSQFGSLTVYSSGSYPTKKSVLLVSGADRLEFHGYIRKFVDDMNFDCNVYCCENLNNYNMLCIDEMVAFVKSLGKVQLTIIGFSLGGVIGSHIVSRLNQRTKLITVDTPYNFPESSLNHYDNFRYWRIDIIGLYWQAVAHSGSMDYRDWCDATSLRGYALFIERNYGISYKEFKRLNRMNPHLTNCRVISVYSCRDPLVYRPIHRDILAKFRLDLDPSSSYEEHEYSYPSHCSVMACNRCNQSFYEQIRSYL